MNRIQFSLELCAFLFIGAARKFDRDGREEIYAYLGRKLAAVCVNPRTLLFRTTLSEKRIRPDRHYFYGTLQGIAETAWGLVLRALAQRTEIAPRLAARSLAAKKDYPKILSRQHQIKPRPHPRYFPQKLRYAGFSDPFFRKIQLKWWISLAPVGASATIFSAQDFFEDGRIAMPAEAWVSPFSHRRPGSQGS